MDEQDIYEVKKKVEAAMKDTQIRTAVIIGAIFFSFILFQINEVDFRLYPYFNTSIPHFFIISIPYLWILIFFALTYISYIDFKHTGKGYKYPLIIILGANLILSGILGWGIYKSNFPDRVYSEFQHRYPMMTPRIFFHHRPWHQPDRGFLAGRIIEIDDGENPELMEFQDFYQKIWIIEMKQAKIMHKIKLENGFEIKMIGRATSPNTFKAYLIVPWHKNEFKMSGRTMKMPPPFY